MTQTEIAAAVQVLLIRHFNIPSEQFCWDKPLEELHENFRILSYLVFLEQLLRKEFQEEIPLLENICTAFHTPADLLELVANHTLKNN